MSAVSLKGNFITPSSSTTGNPPRGLNLSPSHSCSFIPAAPNQQAELGGMSQSSSALGDSHQEVQDLKEQLQALQCQVGQFSAQNQKNINFSNDEGRDCCQPAVARERSAKRLYADYYRVYCTTKWKHWLVGFSYRNYKVITQYDLADCCIDVLCQQTQIYEAEFQTEHNNHKHTLHENRRLRKKREEMRQQVVLLQEQVGGFTSLHGHLYKNK